MENGIGELALHIVAFCGCHNVAWLIGEVLLALVPQECVQI
jgi:hypothetical protein